MNYKIWVDGSSIQQKYGGWAYTVINEVGDVWTDSGKINNATNAAAELYAIKMGLSLPELKKASHITLYTDSNYALGVLTKGHKIYKNTELISEIFSLLKDKNIVLEKIKRRSTKESKIVDALANMEAKSKFVKPAILESEILPLESKDSLSFTFNIEKLEDQDGNTVYKLNGFSGITPYETIIEYCLKEDLKWKDG